MISDQIVEALLEGDSPDPKSFAAKVPTIYDDAVAAAVEQFEAALQSDQIKSARRADEVASEIAQNVCAEYEFENNDDFDEVVTPLYKMAAQYFPGQW